MILSRNGVEQIRDVQTLLELFASWGALYAFLLIFLGAMATKWNEFQFDKSLAGRDLRTLDREHFAEDGHVLLESTMSMPQELRLMTATPADAVKSAHKAVGAGAGGGG